MTTTSGTSGCRSRISAQQSSRAATTALAACGPGVAVGSAPIVDLPFRRRLLLVAVGGAVGGRGIAMARRMAVTRRAVAEGTTVAVRLGRVVVLVHHYDEALAFYTERFGCEVVLDRPGPDGVRFVHVRFPGDPAAIWLLRPGGETGLDRVGAQTGGEPVAVVYTDDLHELVARWRSGEVRFRVEPYEVEGTQVCHVLDLYGNEFVAVQLAELTGLPPARFGAATEWFGPLDQATEPDQPGASGERPAGDPPTDLQ
jgi:catechol 2,3-dioxygenase-like lactoylglutathione lyase family enzyme